MGTVENDWTQEAYSLNFTNCFAGGGGGCTMPFTVVYSDPAGYANIGTVVFEIYPSADSQTAPYNGCQVYIQKASGTWTLYLFTDELYSQGGMAVGSSNTQSNSQCELDASQSSVTMVGDALTAKLRIIPFSTWTGTLYAAGNLNGWRTLSGAFTFF